MPTSPPTLTGLFCHLIILQTMAAAAPLTGVFIDKHCVECHDAEMKKGGLDLTALKWKPEERANFEEWVEVFDRVRKGEMPPRKKERPEAIEQKTFLTGLETSLHDHQSAALAQTGRTVLRRLNRVEYENTLHDLLGIQTPLKDILPEDTPMHGFDTVAEGLRISQLQMEKYLEAADTAIEAAVDLTQEPEKVSKKFFFKDEQNVRKNLDTPIGTITDKNANNNAHRHLMRELPDGSVVYFNSGYPPSELRQFNPRGAGTYRFRISGHGFQSQGKDIPIRVYGNNFKEKHLFATYDMPPDKARVVEFTTTLKNNEHLLIQADNVGRDEKNRGVYNVPVAEYTGPGIALQWVEVEGPLSDTWPPPGVQRLFGDTPLKKLERQKFRNGKNEVHELTPADAKGSVKALIERFAAKAFRRPLIAGEVDGFIQLSLVALDAGQPFRDATTVGFRAVLTSPQFLLFEEAPGPLSDHALASRLSYFLWSTLPDDELMKLAAEKRLSQPAVLRAQVERMLKDKRSAAFVSSFTGQWLELRNIESTTPDKKLYPEFDELLKLGMVTETEAFIAEMIAKDLPATNLVQSEFAMLNRRLAEHYGIAGVRGEEFRRVSLPADSVRGGVLTQASVLKVTANGTTSSPVLRGAWVMKHLLGQPPAPPPPNVGSIEPDTRGATTVRELLDKHRSSESCMGCHSQIDPPGFALECFDVIGGFRERYRSQDKGDSRTIVQNGERFYVKLGPAVDASGQMTDGRTFQDIREFKKLLLQDQTQIIRALAQNLTTYATGAGITFADRREVETIVKNTQAKNGGMRTLIQEIVASPLFLRK
ncbi:MAG TPA: DUF1592 domain-containing protein [Prosthecobacter sp.]